MIASKLSTSISNQKLNTSASDSEVEYIRSILFTMRSIRSLLSIKKQIAMVLSRFVLLKLGKFALLQDLKLNNKYEFKLI